MKFSEPKWQINNTVLSLGIAGSLAIVLATLFVALVSVQFSRDQALDEWVESSNSAQLDYSRVPHFVVAISNENNQLLWTHQTKLDASDQVYREYRGSQYIVYLTPGYKLLANPMILLVQLPLHALFWFFLWRHRTSLISIRDAWATLSLALTKLTGKKQKSTSIMASLHQIELRIQTLEESAEQGDVSASYLRQKTFIDEWTGIGNRQFFDNRLDALLQELDSSIYGAVFLIQAQDIDIVEALHGKEKVKDIYKEVAARLSRLIENEEQAVIARHSDNDFAIMVPFISDNEVVKLAEKLLSQLKKVALPSNCNQDSMFHVGVAAFSSGESGYLVMSEADMALRAAQLQGPSGFYQYDKKLMTDSNKKGSVRWRTYIQSVIEKNAFLMFFQPVVEGTTMRIHHHEVLARIRDANQKMISASVFLPMASKCGMIKVIDKLMLEKTVKVLEYEGSSAGRVSINLSMESLSDKKFREWFMWFISKHKKVANRLIIETSEYQLVRYHGDVESVFQLVHSLGGRLLVDQVGLYVVDQSYLESLPIDYVKLHVSIVRNIDSKLENQLFVRGLQSRCINKKICIFALGVETVEEWKTVQQLELRGGQGHYFNEPMGAIETVNQML